MIRRWSHINLINIEFSKFSKFKKRYKIITLKSLVNLKRFTFKITKFRRKGMARFKHTSNWLLYTNVIKSWSLDYLHNKRYARLQFLNKIFSSNFFVYNFNFSKIRNDAFAYNFNFYLSTWVKKSYYYYRTDKSKFFKYNSFTFIWYTDLPIFNNSVIPAYSEWDNIYYANELNDLNFFSKNFDFLNIFDLLPLLYLNKLTEIKKIITLLYFFNLNFINVK